MPLNSSVKIDSEDTVRFLLFQQFYYGDDRIVGRTKDCFEVIEGAGEIIEAFYDLISEPIYLIDMGHPYQYIKFFNDNIHKIPISRVMEKYRNYKDMLGPEMDRKMTLTVLLGESLSMTISKCFNASIEQLIESLTNKKNLDQEQKKELQDKISALTVRSNPNIGMLFGLSFMKLICRVIGNKGIEIKTNELIENYFNLITELIEK